MKPKAAPGEIALGILFGCVGIFWIAQALRLQLWEGFSPSSGFLPLVYGALLVGLAAAAVLFEAQGSPPLTGDHDSGPAEPVRRPLMVIAVLAAGIGGIELIGFPVSMVFTMFLLFKVVEKLPLLPSFLASAGSALALTLIFRTWLGVPLPKGPWGF